jgi:hypothetical protein
MFAMRTYVIWEQRKIVGIPLGIFYVGTLIYAFISYYSTIKFAPCKVFIHQLTIEKYRLANPEPDSPPPPFNGCLAAFPVSSLWLSMLFLVAYDAGN